MTNQLLLFEEIKCEYSQDASPKDLFYIEPIPYKIAMSIFVRHHYMHRKCPCAYAFGLFSKETGKIVGAISYGQPANRSLCSGICGEDEKDNVIELNRLWINDGAPKNTASYFISQTLRMIDKEIVVSYADIQQGHLGIVYQAANFIYTGLSAKRTQWHVDGLDYHGKGFANKYSREEIEGIYGDRFSMVQRPRKHRYVYFNASKTRRKELMKKLRYDIETYPKGDQWTNPMKM